MEPWRLNGNVIISFFSLLDKLFPLNRKLLRENLIRIIVWTRRQRYTTYSIIRKLCWILILMTPCRSCEINCGAHFHIVGCNWFVATDVIHSRARAVAKFIQPTRLGLRSNGLTFCNLRHHIVETYILRRWTDKSLQNKWIVDEYKLISHTILLAQHVTFFHCFVETYQPSACSLTWRGLCSRPYKFDPMPISKSAPTVAKVTRWRPAAPRCSTPFRMNASGQPPEPERAAHA